MKRNIFTFAATSIIAAAVLAGPAVAATATEAPTQAVDLSAYDVNTEDGAKGVYTRIEKAAKRVCQMSYSARSLREQQSIDACVADAVEAAVTTIDSAHLKAVHANS